MDACAEHSAHERAIEQHDKRLDAHGKELDELSECVVRLTALQEAHNKWQASADERITALETAPARRWERVVTQVLTAGIALVMGYLAAQIGLN